MTADSSSPSFSSLSDSNGFFGQSSSSCYELGKLSL